MFQKLQKCKNITMFQAERQLLKIVKSVLQGPGIGEINAMEELHFKYIFQYGITAVRTKHSPLTILVT